MSINFSDGLEDQAMVTSSSVLPEDAGEGGLRPKTISEYIGQEKAKAYYNHDHTHTSLKGARLNAQSVAEGLRKNNSEAAKLLKK